MKLPVMKINEHPLVVWSTLESKDIVYAEFRPSLKVDLSMAMEIVSSRLKFTHNKKHFLVTDMSNVREITPEAKEFMQKPDGGLRNILGAAFIASNPVSILIANIFIKTPKEFHARFFSSKQDAIDWIHTYRLSYINKAG